MSIHLDTITLQFKRGAVTCGQSYWIRQCSPDCSYSFNYIMMGRGLQKAAFVRSECQPGTWSDDSGLVYTTFKTHPRDFCTNKVYVECAGGNCNQQRTRLYCVSEDMYNLIQFGPRHTCPIILDLGYANKSIARIYYESFSFKLDGQCSIG